jgi:hypothetical protein
LQNTFSFLNGEAMAYARCLDMLKAKQAKGRGMNKILFWVAFAVPSVGLAPNVDSMKNVIFVLIGLAIGLWVYPRLEGRG